jgi:chemotaxis protein methyltransferase CheR
MSTGGTPTNLARDILDPLTASVLVALVQRQFGIVVRDYQMYTLERTVRNGCARFGYSSAGQFARALGNGSRTSAELEFFVSGITVGETYFFRHHDQFEFLRERWVKDVVARKRLKGDRSLRIWSAGCSSGEEIYSISIMLDQVLPDRSEWNINLLGTDINVSALATALAGKYRNWSLRSTPKAVVKNYFSSKAQLHELDPNIVRSVRFEHLNLVSDVFPSILTDTTAIDLILCRNVFIYLSPTTIEEVTAKFVASLGEHGVLMLAPADIQNLNPNGLTLERYGNVTYFQKDAGAAAKRHTNTSLSDEYRPTQATYLAPQPVPASSAPLPVTTITTVRTSDRDIVKHLHKENWADVLDLATALIGDGAATALTYQYKAKALASLGRSEEALAMCERSLELSTIDPHTHFLLGLVMLELNKLEGAEASFRKVIYLEWEFPEAHMQLGMLRARLGALKDAQKHLRKARSIVSSGEPGKLLHDGNGMTYERLAEILTSELTMLEQLSSSPTAHPRNVS